MADDADRILRILLRYVTDARSVEQAKVAAAKLTEAEKAVGAAGQTAGDKTATAAAFAAAKLQLLEKQARLTETQLQRLQRTAAQLQQVSAAVAGTGALIAGPFVAATLAYVNQAGKAEETSRKWGRATERIADAYQDVGRVGARTLLPLLERAADLAEVVARLAEQHPGAVAAALTIGGGLVALGTVGALAAKGIRLYADVKLIAAAALQNLAADKMLAAAGAQAGAAGAGRSLAGAASTVAIAAAAAAAMAYVGTQITQPWTERLLAALEKRTGRTEEQLGPLYMMAKDYFTRNGLIGVGQGIVSGRYGGVFNNPVSRAGTEAGTATREALSPLVASLSRAIETFARSIYLLPAPQGGRRNTNEMQGGQSATSFNAAVPLFANYQEQLIAAERDYGKRKTQIILDYVARGVEIEQAYQADRARIAADFAKQQGRSLRDFLQGEQRAQSDYSERVKLQLRDFAANETSAEAGYYEQRLKRARDFDVETQRAEEDHQARIAELQSDHADRVRDLAGARDAGGIVLEMRNYEKERRREEDANTKSARRRNEDYGRELADGEAAFREQREQRLADFELQLADAKEQFQKDRAQRLADFWQRRHDEFDDNQQRLADLDAANAARKAKEAANFKAALLQLDADKKEERAHLTADFKARLNELDAALLGEQKKRQEYYKRMAVDLEDFLKAARSGQPYTPRKESEYPRPVLIPKQDPAERLLGGGGSAAGGVTLAQSFSFQGQYSEADKSNLQALVENATAAALVRAFGAARAKLNIGRVN